MPSLAAVILTYNSRDYLAQCVAHVRAQTVPTRLVIADNGSSDGTLQFAREHCADAQIIDLGKNWGFAEGYNRALKDVDADWVILLNPDAYLAPDWAEILLGIGTQNAQVAALGGKLCFAQAADKPQRIQSAGACYTDAGSAFELGWGELDTGQYDSAKLTASIPGAALLIRKEKFFALGGFDADYFAYLEDVDLCLRAWLRGDEVRYEPRAVAWHVFGAAGGGRASAFRIQQMQRNRLANMVKHLQVSTLVRGIITSIGYDVYRVLEFARRGDGAALGALWRGTWAFGRALPNLLAQRRAIQATRRRSDKELMDLGLLVSALTAMREYRRLSHVKIDANA